MPSNTTNVNGHEPTTCMEIYRLVSSRQVTALMFHDAMADLFDFLGLQGFKQLHEYQYLVESAEHRALKRYYLNHHGKLLPETEASSVQVIPSDWYKYTRMDVTSSVRRQAVKTAFEQYCEWETETKELYSTAAFYLMNWHKVADFNKINELLMDVDKELKYLERLIIRMSSVDYDPVYVDALQDEYHEKYKGMMDKVGVSIC